MTERTISWEKINMLVDPKCKVNDGSTYCREGQWVIAKYMDTCWITGIVTESRVKYGGRIGHTVLSDSPTVLIQGDKEELRPVGTIFLIEEQNVTLAEAAKLTLVTEKLGE